MKDSLKRELKQHCMENYKEDICPYSNESICKNKGCEFITYEEVADEYHCIWVDLPKDWEIEEKEIDMSGAAKPPVNRCEGCNDEVLSRMNMYQCIDCKLDNYKFYREKKIKRPFLFTLAPNEDRGYND